MERKSVYELLEELDLIKNKSDEASNYLRYSGNKKKSRNFKDPYKINALEGYIKKSLSPLEADIITNHYGLSNPSQSLSEIADDLLLTTKRIELLKDESLYKLKKDEITIKSIKDLIY